MRKEFDPEIDKEIDDLSEQVGKFLMDTLKKCKGKIAYSLVMVSADGPESAYVSNVELKHMVPFLKKITGAFEDAASKQDQKVM